MIYFLAVSTSFVMPNADAVESLEQSIEVLQKRMEEQKKLKHLLVKHNTYKRRFIRGELSKSEAWQMVKISEEANKLIQDEHMESLFTAEFLEELKVFSSFANKSSVALRQPKS